MGTGGEGLRTQTHMHMQNIQHTQTHSAGVLVFGDWRRVEATFSAGAIQGNGARPPDPSLDPSP